jgi:hypothetical protein
MYGADHSFIKVVTAGGMNGLIPEAARYHRALLKYYYSISVDSREALLEQFSTVAAIGASDPLVQIFPALR